MVAAIPHGVFGAGQVLPPIPIAGDRLGLCDVLPGAPPTPGMPTWAQLAAQGGARWNRWEFRWDTIEPQPGEWNFTADDAAVAASRQNGIAVVGVLDGAPLWGVAPGQPRGNGVPRYLAGGINDPRNLWAAWVRGVVTHYRGEVRVWEIWNEPDLHFFWNGNADDYYRTLQVAYRVIKQVDPSARVLIAGMVVPDLLFFRRVLVRAAADVAAGHGSSFDLAAWHVYGPASSAYTNVQHMRSVLSAEGFGDTPVWVTESGFPSSNPTGEPRQAAYVLQTIAYSLAAGAARILIYRASDDPTPRTWGLMTAAGTPRMGYVAFQVAARYLSASRASIVLPDARTTGFVFYTPTQRVVLLWNRGQQQESVTIPSGVSSLQRIDWQGNTLPLTTTDGAVSLTLPGANYNANVDQTNAEVGGPPVLLVEDDRPVPAGGTAQFLPTASDASSQVTLFNAGDAPVVSSLAATDLARVRQTVEIPAHALVTVNPAFLAGAGFQGLLSLDTSTPVLARIGSAPGIATGTNWYVPSTREAVQISAAEKAPVTLDVKAFRPSGTLVYHRHLAVSRAGRVLLATDRGDRALSFRVHASDPIALTNAGGGALSATSTLQTDWYVVHPSGGRVRLFNPGAQPVVAHVRTLGKGTAKQVDVRVSPHRTLTVRTVRAAGVTVKATAAIAVTDHPGDADATLPASRTVLSSAGNAGRLDLFDPSETATAHVMVTVTTSAGSREIRTAVFPNQVRSLRLRRTVDIPAGVVVSADIPVVARVRS